MFSRYYAHFEKTLNNPTANDCTFTVVPSAMLLPASISFYHLSILINFIIFLITFILYYTHTITITQVIDYTTVKVETLEWKMF